MSAEAFPQYPVNLRLNGVQCLVVGGGEIAARKARGLLECGAYVTVVAPTIVDELRTDERVRWHQREYRRGEVASYRTALAGRHAREAEQLARLTGWNVAEIRRKMGPDVSLRAEPAWWERLWK